jgi:hypothetical protein
VCVCTTNTHLQAERAELGEEKKGGKRKKKTELGKEIGAPPCVYADVCSTYALRMLTYALRMLYSCLLWSPPSRAPNVRSISSSLC